MTKRLLVGRATGVIAALLLGAAAYAQMPMPSLAARADRAAAEEVSSGASAGLAVAVIQNGKTVLLKGYGKQNLEQGTGVTPNTVFRVGSVTKQFTAAAILTLVAEHKVSLDEHLSAFLPGFPGGNEVTLYELLTHTSGLHDYTADKNFLQDCRTHHDNGQMIQWIEGLTPLYNFKPGTAWQYSNSGYYLLGVVIEKASGLSLHSFFERKLFVPLGMKHTAIDDSREVVPNRAAGYDAVAGHPSGFRNASFVSMTVPGAAGALRTTLADLVEWNEALFSGKVVAPRYFNLMMTPARLSDGAPASAHVFHRHPGLPVFDYGLGLDMERYSGEERIGHSGTIQGFEAELYTFPGRRLTVIVLSNTFDPKHSAADLIQEAVLRHPATNP